MEELLSHYDHRKHALEAMLISLERLVGDLLLSADINVHSTSGRVKSRGSLAEKLNRKGKSYAQLGDVTDLVGLRIITYFEDDVDKVADLISKEFDLSAEHCIDKRASLEPDRFGYLSLHYVCGLAPNRKHLRENGSFCNELF